MQRLWIKKQTKQGERMESIDVIRSWQGIEGHVFLLSSGDYCYKNGEPCLNRKLIESLIRDPIQQKAALRWLEQQDTVGIEYPAAPEGSNHLDYVLYFRYPPGSPKPDGPSVPWFSAFIIRPDWWGYAERVTINGTTWEMDTHDQETAEDKAEPKSKPKRAEEKL